MGNQITILTKCCPNWERADLENKNFSIDYIEESDSQVLINSSIHSLSKDPRMKPNSYGTISNDIKDARESIK